MLTTTALKKVLLPVVVDETAALAGNEKTAAGPVEGSAKSAECR